MSLSFNNGLPYLIYSQRNESLEVFFKTGKTERQGRMNFGMHEETRRVETTYAKRIYRLTDSLSPYGEIRLTHLRTYEYKTLINFVNYQ
jgi:hypothetical protein